MIPNVPPSKFTSVQFAVQLLSTVDGEVQTPVLTGNPINVASVGISPDDAEYARVTLAQPIPRDRFLAGYRNGRLNQARPLAYWEDVISGNVVLDADENVIAVDLLLLGTSSAPFPVVVAFSIDVGW